MLPSNQGPSKDFGRENSGNGGAAWQSLRQEFHAVAWDESEECNLAQPSLLRNITG